MIGTYLLFVFLCLAIGVIHIIQTKNPNVPIMLTNFQTLKPWFVKRLKEWNMCNYQYHMKFNELRCGLNILWIRKHFHDSHCVCSCEGICKLEMNSVVGEFSCSAHTWTHNILPSLWNSLLCSKEQNDEFHRREYIMGDCPMCGVKFL